MCLIFPWRHIIDKGKLETPDFTHWSVLVEHPKELEYNIEKVSLLTIVQNTLDTCTSSGFYYKFGRVSFFHSFNFEDLKQMKKSSSKHFLRNVYKLINMRDRNIRLNDFMTYLRNIFVKIHLISILKVS